MNTSEPKEPSFITILGRAFTIMEELLKSDKPLGVSELARLTGIPKANTFRIMKTLEELKAVSPKEDGYILGSKMIELGAGAKHNDEFMLVAKPYLQKLSKTCEETVNLGIMFQDYVLFIHTELAEQRSLVASCLPLHHFTVAQLEKSSLPIRQIKNWSTILKFTTPLNEQSIHELQRKLSFRKVRRFAVTALLMIMRNMTMGFPALLLLSSSEKI